MEHDRIERERERERETDRERQTDRQRHTERETDRESERERETERMIWNELSISDRRKNWQLDNLLCLFIIAYIMLLDGWLQSVLW